MSDAKIFQWKTFEGSRRPYAEWSEDAEIDCAEFLDGRKLLAEFGYKITIVPISIGVSDTPFVRSQFAGRDDEWFPLSAFRSVSPKL